MEMNTFLRGYDALRVALAVLLLVAAGLKAHQLMSQPVFGTGLMESRWFLIAVVEFELLFGLWLLSGLLPHLTWLGALACFFAFACVSFCKVVSGAASCGCFGRVPVNPWFTTILDVAVLLALFRWRPLLHGRRHFFFPRGETIDCDGSLRSNGKKPFVRAAVVLSAWLVLGVPAAMLMNTAHAAALSAGGKILGAGRIVVVEPKAWIGKRFPLLDYIDVGDELKKGRWRVLLYHRDCPKCRNALSKYERLSDDLARRGEGTKVAVIDVPTDGANRLPPVPVGKSCLSGRLSEENDWFLKTPLEVVLNGALVAKVEY